MFGRDLDQMPGDGLAESAFAQTANENADGFFLHF
jgi:hypothetical protein